MVLLALLLYEITVLQSPQVTLVTLCNHCPLVARHLEVFETSLFNFFFFFFYYPIQLNTGFIFCSDKKATLRDSCIRQVKYSEWNLRENFVFVQKKNKIKLQNPIFFNVK